MITTEREAFELHRQEFIDHLKTNLELLKTYIKKAQKAKTQAELVGLAVMLTQEVNS